MSDKIIALMGGAHPSHQKIFISLSTKIYFMLGPWFPGKRRSAIFKIFKYLYFSLFVILNKPRAVLLEGAIPSAIIGSIISIFLKDVCIISLVAEDAFYKALQSPESVRSKILRSGFRKIDGVIAIGPMIERQVRNNGYKGEVFVMYPSIEEGRFREIKSFSYRSDTANIIHIGGGDIKYKGVDIVLEIAKAYGQAEYTILGYDTKTLNNIVPENVSLPGRVMNIIPYLEKSSLLIHPGRGDAFPVATLEAMAAGIPVMLSDETGTSDIILREMPKFVRKCTKEDFVEGIKWFLSLEEKEKEKCSEKIKSLFAETLQQMNLVNTVSREAVEKHLDLKIKKG